MNATWLIVTVVALTVTGIVAEKPRSFVLKKDDVGKVPQGWTSTKTGDAEGSVWKVVEDATAPSKSGLVLAQTAASPTALFNLCVAEGTSYTDVEVKVAFKANKGEKDQGGGIVWRYQDANNYYIARMNPLEDNFRVYKVVAGKRMQLATKEELKVPAGEWHTLTIRMTGDRIECLLDDRKHLEAKDDTIAKPGQIGLWTKADAQTSFDGFQVSGK